MLNFVFTAIVCTGALNINIINIIVFISNDDMMFGFLCSQENLGQ